MCGDHLHDGHRVLLLLRALPAFDRRDQAHDATAMRSLAQEAANSMRPTASRPLAPPATASGVAAAAPNPSCLAGWELDGRLRRKWDQSWWKLLIWLLLLLF